MAKNYNQSQYSTNPMAGIIGMVVIFGIIYLLFLTVKGVFSILLWLAPILFILALVMNYKVVLDYGKMLIQTTKENPTRGLTYTILSILGYPFVSAFLFLKAVSIRKINKMRKPKYDEYEDVSDESEDFLELPEMEVSKEKAGKKNDYEDLFEE